MNFGAPASSDSRALRSGASTVTTLQSCKFDDVDADCAAAISSSSVPAASARGRNAP